MSLKALAQLVRLPNVFTAWADVLMAWFVTTTVTPEPVSWEFLAAILGASTAFYWGGMVLNDVADLEEDRRDRPFRPLPSGRISVGPAAWLGFGLLALGYVSYASVVPFDQRQLFGVALVVAIIAYNFWAKRGPLGPWIMAGCRVANVLLLGAVLPNQPPALLLVAGIVGVYILGVTWFARGEAGQSQRGALLLGAAVMHLAMATAGAVAMASRPWLAAAWLLGYLVVVGPTQFHAFRTASPTHGQRAVKFSILALIGLDAVLATAYAGPAGLMLLLLLPPGLLLGRWLYST